MKFLCVPCDQPMKLVQTSPPDRGSISVLYHCAGCDHEMAMLTNPHETQVVTSMGVKIGPGGGDEAAGPAAEGEPSGCPFAEMIPGIMQQATGGADAPGEALPWTAPAAERLARIPSFVRTMAKAGIEKYARDNGFAAVDEQVLDQARDFFDM